MEWASWKTVLDKQASGALEFCLLAHHFRSCQSERNTTDFFSIGFAKRWGSPFCKPSPFYVSPCTSLRPESVASTPLFYPPLQFVWGAPKFLYQEAPSCPSDTSAKASEVMLGLCSKGEYREPGISQFSNLSSKYNLTPSGRKPLASLVLDELRGICSRPSRVVLGLIGSMGLVFF